MINVFIEATVDLDYLRSVVRDVPLLAKSNPMVLFKCGPFTCETIQEVWGLVTAGAAMDDKAAYEKLKEFAP